jgi:hypothetical protein
MSCAVRLATRPDTVDDTTRPHKSDRTRAGPRRICVSSLHLHYAIHRLRRCGLAMAWRYGLAYMFRIFSNFVFIPYLQCFSFLLYK